MRMRGYVIRGYDALWEVNTRLESVCLWQTATFILRCTDRFSTKNEIT